MFAEDPIDALSPTGRSTGTNARGERLSVSVLLGFGRFHIVSIAALAALAFGWFFDGSLRAAAPILVALDWFLLNLWNRIADVPEDARNGVSGTAFVARHRRVLSWGSAIVLAGSVAVTFPLGLPLLAARTLFHLGGFAYSFRLLPGGRRIKDLFLTKNVFSGLLFIVTVLGYPLLLTTGARPIPAPELIALAAFFLPLEITYELLYDLRDVEGDRAEGIPTLPVVHGAAVTRAAIYGLLASSALALVAGFGASALSFAELLMIAAPLQQALVVRFWLRDGVTQRSAIRVTYLGAAQLLSFCIWVGLGLPLRPFG